MRNLARWCVRHRFVVIAVWLVALVALTVVKSSVGTDFRDSFKLSGTQSFQAQTLLQASAPAAAGDSEQVVIATAHGSVRDPAVRTRVEAMLRQVASLSTVASVGSPYGPAGARQISRDGSVAFARVALKQEAVKITQAQAKSFVATTQRAAGDGVQVQVAGQAAKLANRASLNSTGIGVLAALAVLLIVFGSALAAATPLLITGLALGVATAVTGLLSHVLTMASFSTELSLLIGLGVGVDYALFIVTRMRQGIQGGKPVVEAIVDALDTSGRAVMFAGMTVCIALLGMFALGVSFLYGVAVSASIAVAFTVIAALTLLPALLSLIGPRVLSRRQRRRLDAGELDGEQAGGFWTRWSQVISARPALVAAVALLVVAVVAVPFLSMRLGSSDAGSDGSGTTTRKAYDLLAKGFGPGYNGPLQLVAQVSGPGQQARFTQILATVARTPGVVGATTPTLLPARTGSGGVLIAQVYPRGSPQDASTTDLLHRLRDHTVPSASIGSGLHVLIGGQTAIFDDFSSVLSSKLPLFIGIVVALSFLLLTAVFRSLLIPATAAVMNLLSAGAAYGVITAVFQYGWGGSLLGIDKTGPIEAFVPVMMFAIVFGLSMDYQVFLVSRMYEEWHRTGDNRLAVTRGLAATGRTITAAAAIMILVFGAFILGGERVIELFGLGLASAVAIDALIVRSALVPAVMLFAGDRNWALPRALDRILPHLNVEGSVEHQPAPDPSAADVLREPQPSPA